MQEGIDFLYCNLCLSQTGDSEEYQSVGSHLEKHKISGEEYKEMFPGSPLSCPKLLEIKSKSEKDYYKTKAGKRHSEKTSMRYLSDNPMHTPKFRKNFDIAVKNPERNKRISEFVSEQYRTGKKEPPVNFVNHKTIHGYFYSEKNQKEIYFRGNIESKAYAILERDKNVLKYEGDRAVKIIWWDGLKYHTYHPDILVWLKNGKKLLVECKPKYIVEAGGFTGGHRADYLFIDKLEAAKEYCKGKGWKFEYWTEKCLGL